MDTADYRALMYNMNSDFFSRHRELPDILSYAVDRQAIVGSVLLGYGEAAYSPLQKGPFANQGIEKHEYDPERAKSLLEESGWSIGQNGYYQTDGEELAFVINNGQQDSTRISMSNICAQNFQDIGVNATVKINLQTDWAKQDSYLIGWGSPFDPDDHTYKVFGTGKGSNFSGYSNLDADRALAEARGKRLYEERLPLYKEFQEIIAGDLPYTFIAYIDAIYVGASNITGITENTVLGHHGIGVFWNIYDWDVE
jgi:peptide/nickel transport system substrate-binding protein